MEFYLEEDALKTLKNMKSKNKELCSIFLWNEWDENKNYKVTFQIKKIDKRPLKNKLIDMWNNFVRKFLL